MSQSIIPANRIKQALRNGQNVIGTMLAEIRQPSIMQLLCNSGFDFVIIDNEHGAFTSETIADLSRMARLLGVTPIVRVPDLAYPYLAQSLDGGAQGIMLPRVTHPDQVRQAVQIIKYPPVGARGCAQNRGHTDFKAGPLLDVMRTTNDETMLIIQIEMQGALDHLEEIVATPGVDVLLCGPTDLSIALGVPGQLDSPVLHQAIQRVLTTCQQHNVLPAIHINDTKWATHWAKQGMRLVSVNAEVGFLVMAASNAVKTVREGWGS